MRLDKRWLLATLLFALALMASFISTLKNMRLKRLSESLRTRSVPWGEPLAAPRWIGVGEVALTLSVLISLSAVVAMSGFTKISVGVLFTTVAVLALSLSAKATMRVGLVFQKDGLRVRSKDVAFVVPWDTICHWKVSDDRASFKFTEIFLNDPLVVVRSAEPAGRPSQLNVQAMLGSDGSRLLLYPWAGGLDGETMGRYLEESKERQEAED